MWPMSVNSTWHRESSTPSSAGCSCSCPTWSPPTWTRSWRGAASPDRTWSRPACALRSLLALKLFGNARHRHVMGYVLDEGLALFAGLNAIPKRSFLTEYSCRVAPGCYPEADAPLVRYGQSAGAAMGDIVRPRLPHHPLPRRGCPGREALRLQAEPEPEGGPGLPGPGRRDPRLLLCQRRTAQGPAG